MNQEKIGMFIAECRKRKNLTQEGLASIVGVSNRTISKWETGVCMPDYSILPLLCETLDVTINELLSGEKLNSENYQKKLEENLILNIAELKKKTKKTITIIITVIALCLFIFFNLTILENIINHYHYKRYYLSKDKLTINACEKDNMIHFSIEANDKEPIWIEHQFDIKTNTELYKPYRIRKKDYMEDDSYIYTFSIKNNSDIHNIKIVDQLFYKIGSKIEQCQN